MRKPLLRHTACRRAASGQGQGRDAILGVGVVVVERLKSTATPVLGLAAPSDEYRRQPANGRGASREIQTASLHHRGAMGPACHEGLARSCLGLGPWLQTMHQGRPWSRLWQLRPGPDPPPSPRQVPDPALDPLMPRPAGIRPISTTPMGAAREKGPRWCWCAPCWRPELTVQLLNARRHLVISTRGSGRSLTNRNPPSRHPSREDRQARLRGLLNDVSAILIPFQPSSALPTFSWTRAFATRRGGILSISTRREATGREVACGGGG